MGSCVSQTDECDLFELRMKMMKEMETSGNYDQDVLNEWADEWFRQEFSVAPPYHELQKGSPKAKLNNVVWCGIF